jgi:hypothetical protein
MRMIPRKESIIRGLALRRTGLLEQGLMAVRGTIVALLLWAAGGALAAGGMEMCGAAGATATREQARGAVERAERAVRHAAEQRALWTTARESLEQARDALARGEHCAAAQAARFAEEQAHLGIAQRGYRHFE